MCTCPELALWDFLVFACGCARFVHFDNVHVVHRARSGRSPGAPSCRSSGLSWRVEDTLRLSVAGFHPWAMARGASILRHMHLSCLQYVLNIVNQNANVPLKLSRSQCFRRSLGNARPRAVMQTVRTIVQENKRLCLLLVSAKPSGFRIELQTLFSVAGQLSVSPTSQIL